MKRIFIDISDEDGYINNTDDEEQEQSSECTDESTKEDGDDSEDDNNNSKHNSKTIYLIHNEQIDSEDPNISEFLKFCINKGLFDNTFYDMHNAFSVVATKLPQTFEKLSSGKKDIRKRTFIKTFKTEYGYSGDISFIYSCLDIENKGFITWDEFVDFFLPFVQYITV